MKHFWEDIQSGWEKIKSAIKLENIFKFGQILIILFLLLVLCFRIKYDYESLQPITQQHKLSTTPISSTLTITIPQLLPFPLWKTPMVFQVTPDIPLPPGETISLQLLLSSDAVIFLDKDGNVISDSLSLSIGEKNPRSKVAVYPSLLRKNPNLAFEQIFVKVTQDNRFGESVFSVALPAPKDGWWRLIVDRILELSIIGLILQQLGAFFERLEKENKEREGKARQFLEDSTPEKVGVLEIIYRWTAKNKEWSDKPRKNLLEEKRQQWAKNPEHQKRFLQDLAGLPEPEMLRVLEEAQKFFGEIKPGEQSALAISLGKLKDVLNRNFSDKDWEAKAQGILALWDAFDAPSRGVVLKALNCLEERLLQKGTAELENRFFNSSKRRRLIPFLSNRDLQEKLRGYIPEVRTTLDLTPEPEDPPDIRGFLKEQHGIRRNPFGVTYNFFDPLIWVRRENPQSEDLLLSPSPNVIFLSHPDDGNIASLYFSYLFMSDYKNNKIPAANEFILCARLTSVEDFPITPLQQIVQSVARAWLEILPVSPWTALDLPAPQRSVLGGLLVWYLQDVYALRNHLEQNLTSIEDRNALETFLYEVDKEVKPKPPVNSPPYEILMDWCTLRPFQSRYTYLFVQDTAFPERDPSHAFWWQMFSRLLPDLITRNLIPKIFTPLRNPPVEALPAMSLSWSPEQLERILRDRFLRVGGQDLGQLFVDVAAEEARERFFPACQGSYGRMLRLGQRLIRYHVEHRPEERWISLDELDAVIGGQ